MLRPLGEAILHPPSLQRLNDTESTTTAEQVAPKRLLLIEDNPADARLVEIYLQESKLIDCQITKAEELQEGLERLEEDEFDAILLDLTLPDSQGFSTVKTMIEEFPEYTIVVMTGMEDDRLALNSVKAGAQDFIVKGKFDGDLLARTISYAIERHQLQKRIEDYARAIKQNEKRLLDAQKMARIGNWELDIITNRMYWSDEVYRILERTDQKTDNDLNTFLEGVQEDDLEDVRDAFNRSMEKGGRLEVEYRQRTASGTVKTVASQGQIQRSKKSGSLVLIGTVQDISSLRQGAVNKAALAEARQWAERLGEQALDGKSRELLDGLVGCLQRL
jgi:DNA-binding response OmpR family regulator